MDHPAPATTVAATRRRSASLVRVVLLGAWLGVVLGAWVAINVVMEDPAGAGDRFDGLWPPTHPYWFNLLIALVALVPATLLGTSVARRFGIRSRLGSASIAMALGVVCWSVGNLVWFWYNTCTAWAVFGCENAVEAPYPSLADVGFLLLLPCWAFAMVQLSRVLATSIGDVVRLAWIPLVALAITGYVVLPEFELFGVTVHNMSTLFDSGMTGWQTTFSILYLCSDVALLSLAAVVLVRSRVAASGWFFKPVLLASVALLFQYVADLVFDVRVADETAHAGDVADLLYFFALFTMIVALHAMRGVHARMEQEMEQLVASSGLDMPAFDEQEAHA